MRMKTVKTNKTITVSSGCCLPSAERQRPNAFFEWVPQKVFCFKANSLPNQIENVINHYSALTGTVI